MAARVTALHQPARQRWEGKIISQSPWSSLWIVAHLFLLMSHEHKFRIRWLHFRETRKSLLWTFCHIAHPICQNISRNQPLSLPLLISWSLVPLSLFPGWLQRPLNWLPCFYSCFWNLCLTHCVEWFFWNVSQIFSSPLLKALQWSRRSSGIGPSFHHLSLTGVSHTCSLVGLQDDRCSFWFAIPSAWKIFPTQIFDVLINLTSFKSWLKYRFLLEVYPGCLI